MHALATIALAILPFVSAPAASLAPEPAAQAQAQPASLAASAPATPAYPIRAGLATVVDHVATLGGHLVQLPPARVTRVISPTLIELRDAREAGPWRFWHWDNYDRVLAVLPAGRTVSRGDRLVVAGVLRTTHGARLSGELTGVDDDVLEDRRHEVVVVASGVWTVDGVSIAGRR